MEEEEGEAGSVRTVLVLRERPAMMLDALSFSGDLRRNGCCCRGVVGTARRTGLEYSTYRNIE